MTSTETNSTLQSNKEADPTTATIALQLNDNQVASTMNRPTKITQTLNVIGNITAEATLNVWSDLNFQHTSGIKETLKCKEYGLDIETETLLEA